MKAMDKGELRLMVDDMKDLLRDMGKEMAKKIGTIQEPVANERQMQGWKEMTPQGHAALLQKVGVKKMLEWYREMQRREALSNANKNRIR